MFAWSVVDVFVQQSLGVGTVAAPLGSGRRQLQQLQVNAHFGYQLPPRHGSDAVLSVTRFALS